MDELSVGIPTLSIDTGTPGETPKRPRAVDNDSPFATPRFASIVRSDTNDSLHNLVGKSPTLAHVENIVALPSPLIPSKTSKLFASAECPTAREYGYPTSPLQAGASIVPIKQTHSIENARSKDNKSYGLLPPKLYARLQREQRTDRAASLGTVQNLDAMEMPKMVRHRSQTEVEKAETLMHRETSSSDMTQTDYAAQEGHSLFHPGDRETFRVRCHGEWQTFVAVSQLGEGSFSRVNLAQNLRDSRELVAVKTVELSTSGEADRARVDMTVRREIELLEKVSSPLVIKLHAVQLEADRAQLVLDYLPGGDLFNLTVEHRAILGPRLVRRLFAEIVCATRSLHQSHIVHRDLKLENVLLRRSANVMRRAGPISHLLTTLTDLGLAREFDPSSPDLTTRCGSEDYAAPEIIMGQSYDGRQSDAWALGVLLYCLLEGRLPFDVIPGLEHKMKAKVLHRICRIEWRWVTLREAGSYDPAWDGAKRIVSNLLRSRTKRWSLDQVVADAWLCEDVEAVRVLVQEELAATMAATAATATATN